MNFGGGAKVMTTPHQPTGLHQASKRHLHHSSVPSLAHSVFCVVIKRQPISNVGPYVHKL